MLNDSNSNHPFYNQSKKQPLIPTIKPASDQQYRLSFRNKLLITVGLIFFLCALGIAFALAFSPLYLNKGSSSKDSSQSLLDQPKKDTLLKDKLLTGEKTEKLTNLNKDKNTDGTKIQSRSGLSSETDDNLESNKDSEMKNFRFPPLLPPPPPQLQIQDRPMIFQPPPGFQQPPPPPQRQLVKNLIFDPVSETFEFKKDDKKN